MYTNILMHIYISIHGIYDRNKYIHFPHILSCRGRKTRTTVGFSIQEATITRNIHVCHNAREHITVSMYIHIFKTNYHTLHIYCYTSIFTSPSVDAAVFTYVVRTNRLSHVHLFDTIPHVYIYTLLTFILYKYLHISIKPFSLLSTSP